MYLLSAAMLFWYVFPVIVLFACNFLISTFSLTERFHIRTPDIATPFLLLGLHEVSRDTFAVSIVPYFLITILLVGIGVAVFHAYYYGDLEYRRFFKMFWRLTFLITLIVYLLMIILNIIHSL
ncbi:hypothetical protein RU97_GL002500 [Enterococcus canis]|uniref:Lipoprotein n=1 Tax=Enterococcus canis TaxID=214095 RepID=A0A1L8RD45_9ENTE|nr:DUF3397 domain-containing protein [Enterococcus canis]OJG17710.1 hypothetical protein RU97_GL002500 [Enterococcus canis]